MVAASLKLLSEMESASIPSNEHASTTRSNANSSSMREKCDVMNLFAWNFKTNLLFGCNELICYLPFGCKCND